MMTNLSRLGSHTTTSRRSCTMNNTRRRWLHEAA
jgi:hypothetical protein